MRSGVALWPSLVLGSQETRGIERGGSFQETSLISSIAPHSKVSRCIYRGLRLSSNIVSAHTCWQAFLHCAAAPVWVPVYGFGEVEAKLKVSW